MFRCMSAWWYRDLHNPVPWLHEESGDCVDQQMGQPLAAAAGGGAHQILESGDAGKASDRGRIPRRAGERCRSLALSVEINGAAGRTTCHTSNVGELMQLPRWWYILRNHRASQLGWRAASIVQRRLFPLLPHSRYTDVAPASVVRRENGGFEVMLERHLHLRHDENGERACRIIDGEFEFLNESRKLTHPIDWQLASVEPVSHLWRFHLHYQEYLLDLLRAFRTHHDEATGHRIWEIIDDWICRNPLDRPGALSDAWHPFCLSNRIAIWILLWQSGTVPEHMQDRFAGSLESQVRYLERHLEWDLRGNHLLENLRTLALVGAFFDGPVAEKRLDTADRLIRQQLIEQILPSGEHFERSPMYHAQMLSAVLDIRDAAKLARPDLADMCHAVASRMASFLSRILHPDGGIPLLSDSALDETPNPSVLIQVVNDSSRTVICGPAQVRDEKDGYWIWRHDRDFLVFDAGPIGADELPAHAHCDLLNLEATVDGQRLFVDRGVYDYGDGEIRQGCRSTAGHNVLQVDGVEQCDMWSRFRVGYRGHPSQLEQGHTGPFAWCNATHNAYRRIGVPVVGRWIACRHDFPWICVDWAEGNGSHEVTTRLHLHPDVEVMQELPRSVRLRVGEQSLLLSSLSIAELSIEDGWYCPDFGVRHETSVVTISTECTLPAAIGWIVTDSESAGEAAVTQNPTDGWVVQWSDGDEEVRWSLNREGGRARHPRTLIG